MELGLQLVSRAAGTGLLEDAEGTGPRAAGAVRGSGGLLQVAEEELVGGAVGPEEGLGLGEAAQGGQAGRGGPLQGAHGPQGGEPEVEQPAQRSRRPNLVWLWAAVALIGVLVVGAVVWAVSLGGSLPIAGLSTVVPTVSGLEEEAAIAAIEEASLAPEVRRVIDEAEAGTVLRTEPDAGITVSPGAAVTLVISNGPPPAPLMSVTNLSEAQARQALEAFHRDLVQGKNFVHTSSLAGTAAETKPMI